MNPADSPNSSPTLKTGRKDMARALLLGGLLPVIAFAVAEEYYGTIGGLVAGIVFGCGELAYEWWRYRKIQSITLIGNALVIGLGALSLLDNNPVLFKLQPAIMTFALAAVLIGSNLLGRPLLVELSKKQLPDGPPALHRRLAGMNFRIGICMLAIGALSVHAAYSWSTAAWAFLKGVGLPILLFAYMGIEILAMRLNAKRPKR